MKESDTERHLLSSKSSKPNMTNPLDAAEEKETWPGLGYLAARFLLGHPAGQPVFFLYSGHRGAALSERV